MFKKVNERERAIEEVKKFLVEANEQLAELKQQIDDELCGESALKLTDHEWETLLIRKAYAQARVDTLSTVLLVI